MNIKTYKELKNNELEVMRTVDKLYVSPKTLFRKSEFKGLTHDECLSKAIELGWGWDNHTGKYYRLVGY